MKTLCFVLFFLGIASSLYAADETAVGSPDSLVAVPHTQRVHPTIGLALSGGGARGLAAIGVLKAFEESGIHIQAIAGTSIGGVVGGLYAAGYPADSIYQIVKRFDFNSFFGNAPPRRTMFLTQRQDRDKHLLSVRFRGLTPVIPRGVTAGQRLSEELTELVAAADYRCGNDFSKLAIPFKTAATDIVTGQLVVFDHGTLADAMQATIAFPLAFTGVERDSQLLMDGGMLVPVPVELVKGMVDSTAVVVAINTTSILEPKERLLSPVDIANQVTSIMTAERLKQQLQMADLVVTPKMGASRLIDFHDIDVMVEAGHQAGLEAIASLVRLSAQKQKDPANPDILPATAEVFYGIPCSDAKLQVAGNSLISDSELFAGSVWCDGLISDQVISEMKQFIVEKYREHGWDFAHIDSVHVDSVTNTLTYYISEGIISHISVVGNGRTRAWFVRSRFPLRKGEPLSTRKCVEGIADIYSSDLFDHVGLDVTRKDSTAQVTVRVQEKPFSQLRVGWHWDDDFESEQFVEFLDDNINGIGLQLVSHAQYASDRQRYFGSLKLDRIWFTYLTARLLVYHDRLNRPLYGDESIDDDRRFERRTGAEFTLGQQVTRLGAVTGGILVEEVKAEAADVTTRFGLRGVKFASSFENFDQVPFPMTGNRYVAQLFLAGKLLGGEIEYTRFYSAYEGYVSLLHRRLTLHPFLALGLSRSGLPPTEKFYLGGAHSFSGLRAYELSGDKLIQTGAEMRFNLPYRLYCRLRADIGNTYAGFDEIKANDLRYGTGAFVAWDSPIGPFEVGYGFADRNQEELYFNIGLEF